MSRWVALTRPSFHALNLVLHWAGAVATISKLRVAALNVIQGRNDEGTDARSEGSHVQAEFTSNFNFAESDSAPETNARIVAGVSCPCASRGHSG